MERKYIKMDLGTLRKDMMQAMKDHDKQKKEVISSLVSAVKMAGINAGDRENIPEELVDKTILKELKSAKEQLDTCPESRADLKAQYQYNYDLIASYAPKLMSEDEVKAYITEKYSDLVATKDMGKIMKTVMGDLKGKADGKTINAVIKSLIK